KIYYKAVVIQTIRCWHKNRHRYQWVRIASPEINPQFYGQLVFNKGGRNAMGKRQSLQQWCWKNWTAMSKRIKLDHFLTPYAKINSKWITDLNVRPETIQIIRESTGGDFSDIGHSNIFLNVSPEARELKTKIKVFSWVLVGKHDFSWDSVFHSEGFFFLWHKLLAVVSLLSDQIRYFNSHLMNNPIKNGQKTRVDIFSKENMQMGNRYMKRCSISLIREIQIKTIMRYHLMTLSIAKINTRISCWCENGEMGTILHCWWGSKFMHPF
ncbi:LORF2 protein, partial [Crocuta crocuta]